MAPPRDYRKPKNNEMRDLLVQLPHPVKVLDGAGNLLWQNQAAEKLTGEAHWISSPTQWQGQKAVLCVPHMVEEKADPAIAELEAENERLRKHQRSTARRKKQAEDTVEKVVGDISKREQKLKEQLESSELRVRELEASLERSLEGSFESNDFSLELSVDGKGKKKSKAKSKARSKAKSKSKKGAEESQEIAVSASFEAELRSLEEAHSGLRADLASLQAAEGKWKEEKRKLEAARRTLDDENHQLKEESRKLKDEHRHLEELHGQLKSTHHELKESYETLDEAHSTLKETHQSLEVAHGQLHQELEEARGETERLRARLGDSVDTEELTALRSAKTQLEEDKRQLEAWIEELESARGEAAQAEAGSAAESLAQAQAEAEELKRQFETLLEHAKEQAQQMMIDAQAQIQAHAEQVAQQAGQQGYEEGREQGFAAGQSEAVDKRLNDLAAKLEEAEKLNAELKTEHENYREQVEKDERSREPDQQLADRVRQLEEIERAYEEQQTALRSQKEELEQRLTEHEEEFAKLRESLRAKADIDPRALEDLKADLEEAKMALAESGKREVRLSDRLEAAGGLKEEQTKMLALLKEELEGFRGREAEFKETVKMLEGFRDQARSEARKFKVEADEAREASEKLEARLLESRRELAEARSAGPLGKGLSLREPSGPSVSLGVGAASQAGGSGEVASPTVKSQLEFAQSRLRETEKQLDEARAELKKARSEAISSKDTEKLAFQDTLTGLPNRHIVDRYLDFAHKQARTGNRAYSLFLIDIDGFRVLNETFGRDFGDSLLKAVGERLAGMRGANHIIARHNEDRFLLLAADLEKRAVEKFVDDACRSLLGALAHPFEVKGEAIKLTSSIGIALGPGSSEEPRDLFSQAEVALNSAKARGSGSYFVHNDALLQKSQRDSTYQRQMEHAISRDEFSVKYLPLFNLNKGLVTGMELLLRWNHRDQRVLRPEEFLEVAARSGLIFAITDNLWPKAFKALARWRKLRPGFTLSINLTDRELLSPKLVERATAMARSAGVEPSGILFEVRDASHLRRSGTWWTVLGALHEAGFGLVLDDYAGEASMFSTLAYSGFVIAKTTIDEKNPICTPSPTAAKGVQYCAKKVQTKFDPKALKKLGFDMAQGFAVGQLIEETDVDGILGR